MAKVAFTSRSQAARQENDLANRRPPMPSSTTTRGGSIAGVYSRCQSQRDLRIRHGQQRMSAEATLAQAKTQQDQAQVNLERTRILSPVNGYVTNLQAQLGDYLNVGANTISLVDADSFWVDGYFEETNLAPIRVGDRAQIKLMGHSQILRGRVDSIARAINVANAQPNNQGVATVNPIFTWVRLAQRKSCYSDRHLSRVSPVSRHMLITTVALGGALAVEVACCRIRPSPDRLRRLALSRG